MGSKRIKIKAGNTSVDMSQELSAMTEQLVNQLLPDTRRKLEKELSEVEDEARAKWLVRKKRSKDSKGKLYSEIYITPDFQLIGVVGNKAQYAWAIRVGEDEQNTRLQEGKRLSNELLWKPIKVKTDEIADILAEESIKQIKKG